MAKKSEQDPIEDSAPEDSDRIEALPPVASTDDGSKTAIEAPGLDDTQAAQSTRPIPRVPPKPGEETSTAGPKVGRAAARPLGWLIAMAFGLLIGVVGFGLLQAAYLALTRPIEAANAEIAALQARVAELEAEQQTLQEAQTEMAHDYQTALDDLSREQSARSDELESSLREQASMLDALETTLGQQREALSGLEGRVDELPGQDELRALDRRLVLIRAWQEVLKARLQLAQNDPRGALEDLRLAETTLRAVYGLSAPDEQAALDPILNRLTLVLDEIYSNPYAAVQDVEIIWYDLDALINPAIGPEIIRTPAFEATLMPLTPRPVTPAAPSQPAPSQPAPSPAAAVPLTPSPTAIAPLTPSPTTVVPLTPSPTAIAPLTPSPTAIAPSTPSPTPP
jgi:polyhydroxyalkanoate synthesis regulator phasin